MMGHFKKQNALFSKQFIFQNSLPFYYYVLVISVDIHRKRMKNKFCYALQSAGHSQNECLWAWLQAAVYFGSAPHPLLRHYPRLLNVASELKSHHRDLLQAVDF